MTRKSCGPRFVRVRFYGFEISVQRRLDVNDQLALFRHADNHIRTDTALAGVDVLLFDKITMFDHACQFDDPMQCQFAPPTANLGSPQRFDQVTRFQLQSLLIARHGLEVSLYSPVGFASFLFDFRNLRLGLFQCVADRFE